MRARAASLAILLVLASQTAVRAQVGGGRPEDVATLDGILDAYYEVVSRPAGVPADRERDHWIHHPDALVAVPGAESGGETVFRTMTLDEFHDLYGGAAEEPFYEWEVYRVVQRFGNVAHVWSTYVSSREPGGDPVDRGINSIQLIHERDRWWITSWIFDQERAGTDIPAEFLPD